MGYGRTAILLAALTALFLFVGYMIAGEGGMMIALMVAIAMNVFSYWNSDKLVLRMYGAKAVNETTAPDYVRIVRRLSENAGLPMPATYIMDNPQPNAFATGRDPAHAAVAATTGLLEAMTSQEIAGVMAHELAHIKNCDTLTMTITATLAGALSMLANFALFFGRGRNGPGGFVGTLAIAILAPMAAGLVQFAISRSREFQADKMGAEICGRPLWLASALEKLERGSIQIDNRQAEDHPATAHMFIVNPLHGGNMRKLFSTHPSTQDRVDRLHELARAQSQATRPGGVWG